MGVPARASRLSGETSIDAAVFAATARVPPHAVLRSFPREMVVLNLDSGRYYGFNPTAARMLEVLNRSRTVGIAAQSIAGEYKRPLESVRRDLFELCLHLRHLGLLEIDWDDGATS